jgi:glycolate oxidase iron-sulfur subunit
VRNEATKRLGIQPIARRSTPLGQAEYTAAPMPPAEAPFSHLKNLDYSVVQQCMHCGMCLPTCPTYDETKLERNSPRGRIALMRSIADGELEATKAFADEMYFCLGCLACMTSCPAGVNYAELFEHARAEVEEKKVIDSAWRRLIRRVTLKWLFTKHTRLKMLGRLITCTARLASSRSCAAAACSSCCLSAWANSRR